MNNEPHEGEILKSIIKKSKIKLDVLAPMFGSDKSTICRWYKRESLSPQIIEKVCKELKVPVEVYFPHKYMTPQLELTKEIDELRSDKMKLLEQINELQQKVVDLTEDKMKLKDEVILLKNKIIDLSEDLKKK